MVVFGGGYAGRVWVGCWVNVFVGGLGVKVRVGGTGLKVAVYIWVLVLMEISVEVLDGVDVAEG